MKTYITFLVSCLLTASCGGGEKSKDSLPDSWQNDFTIDLYTSGGMRNESSQVNYTHDSCAHIEQREGVIKRHVFALTENDRALLFKKLHELGFHTIKQDTTQHQLVYDKETVRICLYTGKEFCLSENTISEKDEKSLEHFHETYRFLFEFAGSR